MRIIVLAKGDDESVAAHMGQHRPLIIYGDGVFKNILSTIEVSGMAPERLTTNSPTASCEMPSDLA